MNRSFECRENRENITELHHRTDRQDATRRPQHYVHMQEICKDSSLYSTYGFREYKPLIAPQQFEVDALKKEGIISETLAQIRLSIVIMFNK